MSDQVGEFSGYPLSFGLLRLRRTWRVNHSLHLASASMGYIWKPGVNTARCPIDSRHYSDLMYGMSIHSEATGRLLDLCPPKCNRPTCACGFYGYFTDDFKVLPYNGDVEGVIEGWGKCAIGSAGAQVGKARIVALAPRTVSEGEYVRGGVTHTLYQPVQMSEPRWWRMLPPKKHLEMSPLMRALSENYSDVPIYHSVEEAVRDYPLGEVKA